MKETPSPLWFLKKVPLFEGLDDGALARMAETAEIVDVRRRDVLFLPGDPANCLYVVHSGRVKLSKVTREGKALTLDYFGADEVFGESCIVDAREKMAEAVEVSRLVRITRESFESLLARNATLGVRLASLLARRRVSAENKLETLVFRDVPSKLAGVLIGLGEKYGIEDSRGTLVSLRITHQELANLIGSTRETVSLTLSQFKRSNLICVDGRKVIISDRDSLRALL